MYKLQLDTQDIAENCVQNLSELFYYLLNEVCGSDS